MSSAPANAAVRGQLGPGLALLLLLFAPCIAWGQASGQNSLFLAPPSSNLISPAPVTRGEVFDSGGTLSSPSPWPLAGSKGSNPDLDKLLVPTGKVALALSARFGKGRPLIEGGLIWRVYAAKPDAKGDYRLVKETKTPTPTMVLPAGDYILHVGFGLTTAVRPVTLRGQTMREVFDLPAGALRMEGRVGNVRIPSSQISFSVYKGSQFDPDADKRPIVEHVTTGEVVVVPLGTYHIVSHYGDANAVVRSDIRVQTGKLTDVTVTHHAAAITLKLVTEKGGEALANTAWSVLTPGGDVVKESIGAFPRVILAEGEYRAIARNGGKVYERDFKVVTGVDGDVEVLAR